VLHEPPDIPIARRGPDHRRVGPFRGNRPLVIPRLPPDGTAGAAYTPSREQSEVKRVEFWLRNKDRRWIQADSIGSPNSNGTFVAPILQSTSSADWNGTDAAVSVHVVWPSGTSVSDPVSWVWSDHFRPATDPVPEDLTISGEVSGKLLSGIRPHPISTDDPRPMLETVVTWTRCSTWSMDVNSGMNMSFYEADIVGMVSGRESTLSIVLQDLKTNPITGTYRMDQSGFTPIDVSFEQRGVSSKWSRTRGADAVVTFADKYSGTIAARLPDRPLGDESSSVNISGSWRCAGIGQVTAMVPALSQQPALTPVSAPTPPPAVVPPLAPPPQPVVAAPAESCYPVSNSGTCYRPGELCRQSDYGSSGVTADGRAIVCQNNNGWRWEPG
jgi:hypothetical protein